MRLRESIFRMMDESDHDKIGGMSLASIFLNRLRDSDSETAENLLSALGGIIEDDTGGRLASAAWLVGALHAYGVKSPKLVVQLRRRLIALEVQAETIPDDERIGLTTLRDQVNKLAKE